MRLLNDADQGCLDGVFGVLLVAGDGRGEADEPLGRQVEQQSERIAPVGRDAVNACTHSLGELELAGHVTVMMRGGVAFV
jgi:hypothetical protein